MISLRSLSMLALLSCASNYLYSAQKTRTFFQAARNSVKQNPNLYTKLGVGAFGVWALLNVIDTRAKIDLARTRYNIGRLHSPYDLPEPSFDERYLPPKTSPKK